MIDLSKATIPPFPHQVLDAERMFQQPFLLNFSEMGSGKSASVVHAACALYEAGLIRTVIVAAPAQCTSVWHSKELGEIQKHAWQLSLVHRYHGGSKRIRLDSGLLNWIVVSYEFLRQSSALRILIEATRQTRAMLVMDESIFLKSPKAVQTKSLLELSHECDRRYALNGTPHGGRLEETYSQFRLVDQRILGCDSFYHFRARYCVLGGFQRRQVVKYKNETDYFRRTKPYVIRRLKSELLDLPPKLYTHLTVPLSSESWLRYKQMRDDLAAWLHSGLSATSHAPVRIIRLSQLTSGFLGGLKEVDPEEFQLYGMEMPVASTSGEARTEVCSDEKLRCTLNWLSERLEADSSFRCLIWCRFRLDVARLQKEIMARFPVPVFTIIGGQGSMERHAAKVEGETGSGAAILLGNQHAGGFGLTLTSFNQVFYYSSDYSLLARMQSEDRCHRPSARGPHILYTDLIATGPNGEKTVDGVVLEALQRKEDLLSWSSAKWESAILAE